MIVTLDDCQHAKERLAIDWSEEPGSSSQVFLPTIQVADGGGAFTVTASLSGAERPNVTVDVTPGALHIRSGSVLRRVPLPHDALLDQAVVQISDELLTISQERGPSKR